MHTEDEPNNEDDTNYEDIINLPEIIDEESRPNEIVQSLHDWTSKEQDKFPLSYEHHLHILY